MLIAFERVHVCNGIYQLYMYCSPATPLFAVCISLGHY